jgi:MYXO-CTERM domain-containing protein
MASASRGSGTVQAMEIASVRRMRLVGAFLVVLGCLLLAADGTRWDVLLVALPSGGPGGGKHGLEASEVAGFALALAGVAALWRRRS